MHFDVITIFPDLIESSFDHGITAKALKNKKVSLKTLNPRDFSNDKNGKVDDRP